MDTKGLIIIWGPLTLCVVALVVGYCISNSVAASLLRIFGILGILAWIALAFYIANAMNTDI